MDGRCATCKWWKIIEPTFWDNPGTKMEFIQLGRGIGSAHVGECSRAEMGTPDTLAMAVDCEDYSASLLTFADFGCVQWESKDDVLP